MLPIWVYCIARVLKDSIQRSTEQTENLTNLEQSDKVMLVNNI